MLMNRGLNIMVNIFKRKKDILIIVSICVIIICAIKTYCDTNLTLKSVAFENRTYYFYPECIRYHVKANGYDKKLKDDADNNLYVYAAPGPGRELQPTNAKMQGYGNYVFKEDTTLFDFINFCYERESHTANNICEHTKMSSYSGKKLNSNGIAVVNNFWRNMLLALGEIFNYYQDLYFFERYVNEGAELVYSANRLANNGKEFLTCMMSYIFSTNQNSASHFEVKKGDIVPFLYVKEHTNNSDLKNNPRDIARFSYLACINGWAEVTTNDLWFEEYESIFGEYDEEALCELVDEDIETLEKWYFETDAKYQNQKGNKGNALLGATIDEIIESDYSITQQLEATDYYLQTIEGIGDYKENMARNELMAKYMMENSHIGDIIKDYNVGITFITENLQRGTSESKNTGTAVLSDFQVLEFDHKLNRDGHSDEDGLSDLTELTNNTKWVNITGPAEKTYNDMLSKGKTTKTMNDVFEDFVKKSPGMVKYENDKLYYKTYDYNSNPMLNDTDFDGLNDNQDSYKINGTFKASSNSIGNVEWTNDFRYFFVDSDKYNDELSTMSLMMCNLSDGNRINGSDANGDINTYLRKIGFTNVLTKTSFRISDTENISGKLYVGKKTIQVGANNKSIKGYKDVYGVFLGDFDTELNYKKLVSNFNEVEIETYYNSISADIDEFISSYIMMYPSSNDSCFWICGYSIAGGIASHVSPYLIGKKDTFAYTFGAPNTTRGGNTANTNVKNVINEDDLVPKVINNKDGYSRVGTTYNDSIFDNLKSEYRKLIGNNVDYKANPRIMNTIGEKIRSIKNKDTTETLKERASNLLAKFLSKYEYLHDEVTMGAYPEMPLYLNTNVQKVKSGHSIKSYYVLSKSLNGFDLNNEDERWAEKEEEVDSEHMDNNEESSKYVVEAIKLFGEWYIKHVATYQKEPGDENHQPTIEAENYWNRYKDDNSRIMTSRFGDNAVYKYLSDDDDLESGLGYDETPYYTRDPHVTGEFTNLDEKGRNKEQFNLNKGPNYLGDYCAEFAIAVIQYVSNGKRGNVAIDATKAKRHEYGINIHNTYAKTMYGALEKAKSDGSVELVDRPGIVGGLNFYNAMYNLGFKRYFAKDMTVDDLQPGDLLVSDDHVEFYLGEDYQIDNNGNEVIVKIDKNDGKAYSTYGWGNVQNRFPFNDYYFSKDGDDYFKLHYPGGGSLDNKYTVIWRLEK